MELTKTFKIENNLNNLDKINRFIEQELEKLDQPISLILLVEMSFEEIFSNICNYAYSGQKGKIEIAITINDDILKITFKDTGIEFNPLVKEDPNTHLAIEDRPIGGLGIFLVKKKMDDFQYEYKNGTNINILVKHLV